MWIKLTAVTVLMWSGAVWGATLRWDANRDTDLAGYRVYRCTQQPCGRAQGTASLLASVGNVTSYNIGTPAVTQYYVITAYDTANNESSESNVVTYAPPAPAPSEPPPAQPPALVPPPAPSGLRVNPFN